MSKLAINGGKKVCTHPVPSWPHYPQDEINIVSDVLASGKVNQWTGEKVIQFEKICAAYFGQPHGVAVFNGTVALDLALKAFGIGPGDEVIVTPRSFLASVSCVVTCGATPVFADVELDSQNISARTIEAVISPKTKAIIPVHLNGWPCDMPEIMALAEKHNIFVIEDCAQAHGATLDGRPIGSFGHAAAFSFCQDKIITTGGEGGMVLFRDQDAWNRAWSYKDHGKNYDAVFNQQHRPGHRWVYDSFGTNWRMMEIQAALGIAQFEKLPDWHAKRREIAQKLTQCIQPFAAVSVPTIANKIEHAWYRFNFHVDESQLNPDWDRLKLMAAINAEGVACLEICSELYRESAFSKIVFPAPQCPNTIALGKQVLQIKIHPRLDEMSVKQMCDALTKVLAIASQ